jgi:hemoglobin-like flavoprotein
MNLSPRQIVLVRSTFALLEPKGQVAALAFLQKLFSLRPALQRQMPHEIESESRQLMSLLRVAADFADEPETLKLYLAKASRTALSYDPGGAHHAEAGEALLWSLATTLGENFTPEVRKAWADLHATMGELNNRQPPATGAGR